MSLFEASRWVGGVFGNASMGYAVQNLGMATSVILGALISLLAMALLIPVRRGRRKEEREMVTA